MERDRGAQRVNNFNHCCYARARGMVRKERGRAALASSAQHTAVLTGTLLGGYADGNSGE
jgi:hypothetical protein